MKIGIDLGGSHIAVGIVTDELKLIAKEERNIKFYEKDKENIKQEIRDSILSLINNVLGKKQIPVFAIEEIGICVPGIVKDNIIEKCEKYGIYNWDLAKELEEHYKLPVKIQNDALCAAKAEKEYGSLKDADKAIYMCLGTGIGGAIILDNNIFPSEIGHMVIESKGRKCHCGKQGCFEQYSSMRAFKEGIIELLELNKNTTSEKILEILNDKKEDKKINEYIGEFIDTLIIGISNIINTINPEVICIGGSFIYFEEILYKKLLEKIVIIKNQFKVPKIVLSKLQNTAGILGAVLI